MAVQPHPEVKSHKISMLGTGLICNFYTQVLHGQRNPDRVLNVYSRTEERGHAFQEQWGIPRSSTSMEEVINDPETDVVVIGLPNSMHEEAIRLACEAGKAIMCTKPLCHTAEEAERILAYVKDSGVWAGYLEDLCYTPKTLKALAATKAGALGDITWVRSREAHPGPHSAWFWDKERAGGGCIIDMGCHCVEIIRNFVGKENRPVEVMAWADTLFHPIPIEDNAIGLIRFESGAVGQVECSWTFRGGMDLRDEVSGTQGMARLDHFLRTGFEMYTSGETKSYVAEKAENESGWLFPVGDEAVALGYVDMFTDMFRALEAGEEPQETFYDGYVVAAVLDAFYESIRTKAWAPVKLDWKFGKTEKLKPRKEMYEGKEILKTELLPDGRKKLIVQNPESGEKEDIILSAEAA